MREDVRSHQNCMRFYASFVEDMAVDGWPLPVRTGRLVVDRARRLMKHKDFVPFNQIIYAAKHESRHRLGYNPNLLLTEASRPRDSLGGRYHLHSMQRMFAFATLPF